MHRHMKTTTTELMARLRDQNDILHQAIKFDPKKKNQAQ